MSQLDNHVILLGNVVSKDNPLKYFADGTAMLSLQLLTKRKWRDGQGKWQEFASYFNVTVLGHDAEELAHKKLTGQGLYVRGQLRQKHLKNGDIASVIETVTVKALGKASAVNWNQAHICGELQSHTALVQTINGSELITLNVVISEPDDKEQIVEVKLKGAVAKFVASQLTEHEGSISVLAEGAVASQSKKMDQEFVHQYWVDGHTCVLSAD